eukprot:UN11548
MIIVNMDLIRNLIFGNLINLMHFAMDQCMGFICNTRILLQINKYSRYKRVIWIKLKENIYIFKLSNNMKYFFLTCWYFYMISSIAASIIMLILMRIIIHIQYACCGVENVVFCQICIYQDVCEDQKMQRMHLHQIFIYL